MKQLILCLEFIIDTTGILTRYRNYFTIIYIYDTLVAVFTRKIVTLNTYKNKNGSI